MQPKIIHIITDLNGFGGAENTLFRYLNHHKDHLENHFVVVLKTLGVNNTVGLKFKELGIDILELNLDRFIRWFSSPFRFASVIIKFRPNIISAWLYHSILFVEIFRIFIPRKIKIVWQIRSLPFNNSRGMRFYIKNAVYKFIAFLSHRKNLTIVSNSLASKEAHEEIGFFIKNWIIISNGVDSTLYSINPIDRINIRNSMGIDNNDILICAIGRFVPQKGYKFLFNAINMSSCIKKLRSTRRVCFIGVGSDISIENESLMKLALSSFNLKDLYLLGRRFDIPVILGISDLFIHASISESSPNVILEAMASGLIISATNVGDVGKLGLENKFLANPKDLTSLSMAIDYGLNLSEHDKNITIIKQKNIVKSNFDINTTINKFDFIFNKLLLED